MAIHIDSCAPREAIRRTDSLERLRAGRSSRRPRTYPGARRQAFPEVPACPVPRFNGRRRFVRTTHDRHRSPHEVPFWRSVVPHLDGRVDLPTSSRHRLNGLRPAARRVRSPSRLAWLANCSRCGVVSRTARFGVARSRAFRSPFPCLPRHRASPPRAPVTAPFIRFASV